MDKTIAKIKKLLRLANSENEHEAKLAMAKAQKLMADYKINMRDLGIEDSEVIKVESKFYFTTYRNNYRNILINSIANLYCCEPFLTTAEGSQKHYISLIGYESDINILISVMEFADNCINDWFKYFKSKEGWKYSNTYLNGIKNDYGRGFAQGLKELLEEQLAEKADEWGLVMVVPKEATDFRSSLSEIDFKRMFNRDVSKQALELGYEDGLNAEINNKIMA